MRRVIGRARCILTPHGVQMLTRQAARFLAVIIFRWNVLWCPPERDQNPVRIERFAVLKRPPKLLYEKLVGLFTAGDFY